MSPELHPLLRRLVRKAGVDPSAVPSLEAWQSFVGLIDRTYHDADNDRYTLERAIDVSSREMHGTWRELQLRCDDLTTAVFGFAALDFSRRATIREDSSAFDGLAAAVNMLFEEIAGYVDSLKLTQAELRRNEDLLRQTQKMEAIGRLAGGVAHDFNNILSVVLGNAELLLEDVAQSSPSYADIEEIAKAGRRGAHLTRQLLLFSRQEVIRPRRIDLGGVMHDIGNMLRRVIGADIKLTMHLADNLPAIVADPGGVEQVIMNLAVNARDAMPVGGKLTIETTRVDIEDPSRSGPYVMLAVTDTGTGMDAATKARIFEPFFTTKAVGRGTGLGLATVFGIVKQAGGWVDVYSDVGIGTVFKIYFPMADGAAETVESIRTEVSCGNGETVLLVEDEEQVRRIAHAILERHGYRVIDAPGPSDALRACKEHDGAIDLVVTDVVMPEMSGVELARQLIALRPAARILYMSGYTDDTIVRHGILASGAPYLQKPFTPFTLGKKVRTALENPAAESPDRHAVAALP